jgi:hypothetical protein
MEERSFSVAENLRMEQIMNSYGQVSEKSSTPEFSLFERESVPLKNLSKQGCSENSQGIDERKWGVPSFGNCEDLKPQNTYVDGLSSKLMDSIARQLSNTHSSIKARIQF